MNKYTEEAEDVQFSEPIKAQKQVRCGIQFAEKEQWEIKMKTVWTEEQKATMAGLIGQKFDACKLTLTISDDSVQTEHENAKPKLTIEDQFNIESYPYPDKKTGELKKLGRQKLYELEEVFGFDPCFEVDGQKVEPFVNKVGRKVAPKVKDKEVKRKLNPDFFNAYFDENGEPRKDNWIGKVVYADIALETSEQYGSKNVIGRYVRGPQA